MYVRSDQKYCSKKCADIGHSQFYRSARLTKVCPVCNEEFTVIKSENKQFCSRKCANIGRKQYHPVVDDALRERCRQNSKKAWQNPEFRAAVSKRMIEHNPVYMPGVVEKANETRKQNNKIKNNFKYGNGKISPYEQKVYNKLIELGFEYNYPIITREARKQFPDRRYAHAYKPDFVNLGNKLCIEIDGYGHSSRKERETDRKKEECLSFLGFTIIRFTHTDIDNGEFDTWLNSYLNNTYSRTPSKCMT